MIVSSRLRFLAALAFSGVIVASSGCSVDESTAPGLAPSSAALAKGGNSGSNASDSANYTFSIDPRVANTLDLGDHSLYIPASAICSVGSSSYGAGTWEQSCAAQSARMTITAKVKAGANGLPRIDFEPALRFSPDKYVQLAMYVRLARQKDATSWRVLYCATASSQACVDESLADPSLATYMLSGNNWIGRRIKHFSGYVVAE